MCTCLSVRTNRGYFQIEAAVVQLLPSLDQDPVGVEGLRIHLLLTELLHVMQKHERQQSTTLAVAAAAAFQRLSAESVRIVGERRLRTTSPSQKIHSCS